MRRRSLASALGAGWPVSPLLPGKPGRLPLRGQQPPHDDISSRAAASAAADRARADRGKQLMSTASSRRRFLLMGSALGAALLTPAFAVLAFPQSAAAPAPGMEMNGHAAGSPGVPRAPFIVGAPLVQQEVRRSANGE